MPRWFGRADDQPEPSLRIVVGLGNPGSRFEDTRHNVGFMVVDTLAERHEIRLTRSRHRALIARGTFGTVPVLLAKPVTYMNESGIAVSHLVRYYRVPLQNIVVICDDLDLAFGTLRVRPEGSSGGNRGLESIIREVGSSSFPRLRLGIGRPRHEAVSHVLSRFEPEEERQLPAILSACADAVASLLTEGVETAMNRFNRNWSEETVRAPDK
jgi:PTH1 family peptidyl-tRNA hydrolase